MSEAKRRIPSRKTRATPAELLHPLLHRRGSWLPRRLRCFSLLPALRRVSPQQCQGGGRHRKTRPGGAGERGSRGADGRRSRPRGWPPLLLRLRAAPCTDQARKSRSTSSSCCRRNRSWEERRRRRGRRGRRRRGRRGRRRWSSSAPASCSEPASSSAPARPRDRRTTLSAARSPSLAGPRRIRAWGGEKLVVVNRICARRCSVAARHPAGGAGAPCAALRLRPSSSSARRGRPRPRLRIEAGCPCSEFPEDARRETLHRKMQNQMQLLLELLQYKIDLHFEDALADAVSAGVSLMPT